MADRVVRVVLRGEVDGFVAGMRSASSAVQDTARNLTAADQQAQEFRDGLSTVADSAGALGLAAAAGFGAVVVASSNFESAMSLVDAATHETAGNMELLRAAALKAGADTVFSATEAADAVTALAKAGVSTKDILAGGLDGALSLASAGELEVADAAEIAATAMNQFGLGGDQAGHVADILAAAAGKAQGEVSDMADSLNYVGPVAKGMGISIEETAGSIAYLASQGIIGETSGTALRGMLSSLTSPSKVAAQEMKNLGIELYDAQGKFVGFDGVAGELHRTMANLTDAERDQAYGRLFGNEQITAARILYAGGAEAIQKWTAAVNEDGFAADTAARKLNNLSGDFEQLKGSIETALIGAGEDAQGPLRHLVQGATDAVNVFNKLPSAVQGSVTALLGITAVTGGGIFLGAAVIGRIAATREALDLMGVSATRARFALSTIAVGGATLAGLAAIGFALHQLEKDDATPALRKYSAAFEKLGQSSAASAKDIDDLFDASGSNAALLLGHKASIDGVRDAFEKLNASDFSEFGSWVSSGFGTFDTETDLATKAVAKADAALSKMVASGNIEEAKKAYALLAKEAKAAGLNQDELADRFPTYTDSLPDAAEQTVVLADGTKLMGDESEIAAQKLELSDAALKKLQDSASDTAHEFFGLGKAVNDDKVSLSEWIADLDKQSAALRDFTKNARKAGRRGLEAGLIDEFEAAGPAGAMRLKELANATDAEITKANRAWRRGQKAIDAYIKTVTGVPPTEIDVDARRALSAIEAVRQRLLALRSRNINVSVSTLHQAEEHRAAGGPIYGPGTKTSDSIPAMLSTGEYVIQASAVDHYGLDFFDRANQRRLAAGGRSDGKIGNGTIRSVVIEDTKRGGYDSVKSELHDYRIALRKSTTAIEKETSKRDDLVSQRDDLISSIKTAFTRDLFGDRDAGFAWKSDADRRQALVGDPLDILRQDIANGQAYQTQLAALARKGLDGQAYAALAGTGDLQQVQAFASLTPAQIAEYEQLFNKRAQVATAAGNYAGSAAFGKDIAAMNAHLKVMNARGNRLEAIEKRLEKLAKDNPKAVGTEVGKAVRGAGPKRPKKGN